MSNDINLFHLFSIIITITAVFSYLNQRFIKLPPTIAILSGSLFLSFAVLWAGEHGFEGFEQHVRHILNQLDFYHIVVQGMLGFLLFAGALTVDIHHLKERKWEITLLAGFGTCLSTVCVASLSYGLSILMHLHLSYLECLLFGALISPTDPIAVLAIFRQIGVPHTLHVTVVGESLFNDGVGIVLFLTLYQLAFQDVQPTWQSSGFLFLRETGGGIGYGILLGIIGHYMLKPLHDAKTQNLVTLAIATGGYALANSLDISGPLAMVTAGIFIGNKGRYFSLPRATRQNLHDFWQMIDDILNAILFFLIGSELLLLTAHEHMWVSLYAIPIVLLVRYGSVALTLCGFKKYRDYPPHFVNILTWGGLRGGLSVALALALPSHPNTHLIVAMTYAVVVFSILVQGTSIKSLARLSKIEKQKNVKSIED